jgi:hypothetical protein
METKWKEMVFGKEKDFIKRRLELLEKHGLGISAPAPWV